MQQFQYAQMQQQLGAQMAAQLGTSSGVPVQMSSQRTGQPIVGVGAQPAPLAVAQPTVTVQMNAAAPAPPVITGFNSLITDPASGKSYPATLVPGPGGTFTVTLPPNLSTANPPMHLQQTQATQQQGPAQGSLPASAPQMWSTQQRVLSAPDQSSQQRNGQTPPGQMKDTALPITHDLAFYDASIKRASEKLNLIMDELKNIEMTRKNLEAEKQYYEKILVENESEKQKILQQICFPVGPVPGNSGVGGPPSNSTMPASYPGGAWLAQMQILSSKVVVANQPYGTNAGMSKQMETIRMFSNPMQQIAGGSRFQDVPERSHLMLLPPSTNDHNRKNEGKRRRSRSARRRSSSRSRNTRKQSRSRSNSRFSSRSRSPVRSVAPVFMECPRCPGVSHPRDVLCPSRQCRTCRQMGDHYEKQCKTPTCGRCKQYYFTSTCPCESFADGECLWCGDEGHTIWECTGLRQPGGQCFRCKKFFPDQSSCEFCRFRPTKHLRKNYAALSR